MLNSLLRISQKTALTLVFGLFSGLASAQATTYYFSNSGNDSNKGTSISAPKKSLAAATALAKAGNKLLFKRGDAWYIPFGLFDLSNKSGTRNNPVIIDAYGAGDKPVISNLNVLSDDGWENIIGTTTWKHAIYGYSKALRLFANGVSKYKVNTSDKLANETDVDQPHEWFIKEGVINKNGIVYMNTGSSLVAPKNVEVLMVGSKPVVLMENTNYFTFRNIDFRGGSTSNIVNIWAPSANITFDSCIIQQGAGSGIQAGHSGQGDLTTYVANINILNCLVDKVWSDYENDPNILLSGDGIFMLHAVEGGLVQGNKILNWGHSGISITSYILGVHGVHNLIVEMNDVSGGESAYTHAIDMNGFEGLTTHNIIRRNYFHDYTVTGHILGSYNQIYSNIFAGVTVTKMPRHSHQGWGVDWAVWRYRGTGPWIEAHHNYLVNNTFVSTEECAIMIQDSKANPIAVSNNVIANNIIYNFGDIAIDVNTNVAGTVIVQHNNFWQENSTEPVARFKNLGTKDVYNAAELNLVLPQYFRGNTQFNPRFTDVAKRNFTLTESSPTALKYGGTTQYTSLLGEDFVDYFGKKWDPFKPSMGAIQYNGGD
ncbi:hypothetical protein ICJ84_08180 [Aestuariibaculum suncheonense]|uniref:Parallel beta helix pectate lyase-like protein n=1 Tax=Aestuariibaculum suncheonense TaxID=1028745 RepID=A0A8J6UGV4_9FLAO|nr:hypothetical protein [Aestuariibaculum suncheonense]